MKIDPTTLDLTELESMIASKNRLSQLYGNDDHAVSRCVGQKLGLSEYELSLMDAKIFINNGNTYLCPDWNQKVGAYADQRVAPHGVTTLRDRLSDAIDRYKNKPGTSMNNPRTRELIQVAYGIEGQIMGQCSLTPDQITDNSVDTYFASLWTTQI